MSTAAVFEPKVGLVRTQAKTAAALPADRKVERTIDALSYYLTSRLRLALDPAAPPRQLSGGRETLTLLVRLSDDPAARKGWPAEIVAKSYTRETPKAHVAAEFATQRYVCANGFAAPKPLWIESKSAYVGGPFFLMERLPGRNLVDVMLASPLQLWKLPRRFAWLHAQLHRLPVQDAPLSRESWLDRKLCFIAETIDESDDKGLKDGLRWLLRYRPWPPEIATLAHLDFHPLNVIDHNGALAAVDWSFADRADYHADVAMTLTLLECGPREGGWGSQIAVNLGRPIFARRYLRAYRSFQPIVEHKLNYYRAFCAMLRLCIERRLVPLSHPPGFNPNSGEQFCRELSDCFGRLTGTRISRD